MFLFQELEDSFNYGLFQPPLNGRAGETKMLTLLPIILMLMLLMLLMSFMQKDVEANGVDEDHHRG